MRNGIFHAESGEAYGDRTRHCTDRQSVRVSSYVMPQRELQLYILLHAGIKQFLQQEGRTRRPALTGRLFLVLVLGGDRLGLSGFSGPTFVPVLLDSGPLAIVDFFRD